MKSPHTNLPVDAARETICRELAGCLRAGSSTMRVRIVKSKGEPAGAWFYSHARNGWQKRPEHVTDREIMMSLDETVGMLISTGHADEWSIQRHEHSDGYDADLRLRMEKLKDHLSAGLESALYGLLFRDQHASKKDARRSIRTPQARSDRK